MRILDLLLRATRTGKITWSAGAPDDYSGAGPGVSCQIRFLRPLLGDGTTSGNDIAEVTVGRHILTYCSGTLGMDLVRSILAAGLPEWREHAEAIEEREREAEEALRTLCNE